MEAWFSLAYSCMTPNELTKIIQESGLAVSYQITFPELKTMTDEVDYALRVLAKNKAKVVIEFVPKKTISNLPLTKTIL